MYRLNCFHHLSGKTGIRTLGTRKGTTVFETVPIDRSGIFPRVCECKVRLFVWGVQVFGRVFLCGDRIFCFGFLFRECRDVSLCQRNVLTFMGYYCLSNKYLVGMAALTADVHVPGFGIVNTYALQIVVFDGRCCIIYGRFHSGAGHVYICGMSGVPLFV